MSPNGEPIPPKNGTLKRCIQNRSQTDRFSILSIDLTILLTNTSTATNSAVPRTWADPWVMSTGATAFRNTLVTASSVV